MKLTRRIRTRRALATLGLLACPFALVACSGGTSGTPRAPQRPVVVWSAGSSVVAMPTEELSSLGYHGAPAWASDRNDAALGVVSPDQHVARGAWPEEPRPSLRHPRRVYLPDHPDTIIFFHDRGSRRWRWRH